MAQGREGDWRRGTVQETVNRRLVWTGRENMGPLVGDVPEYGTGFIGRAREGGGSVLGHTTSGTDETLVWSRR